MRKVENLALEPRPIGSEKLFEDNAYRVRQGDNRIIYTIDDRRRVVEVYKVGHRCEVYR